jgi:hypothetical protein
VDVCPLFILARVFHSSSSGGCRTKSLDMKSYGSPTHKTKFYISLLHWWVLDPLLPITGMKRNMMPLLLHYGMEDFFSLYFIFISCFLVFYCYSIVRQTKFLLFKIRLNKAEKSFMNEWLQNEKKKSYNFVVVAVEFCRLKF